MPMREADATALSDEKLIEMCILSDQRAWETLIKRYEKYIYTIIIRGFHHSRESAEDIYQECIIKIVKGLQHIQNRKNFKGFIIQVVKNTCLDEWRKEKKKKERENNSEEPDYERLLPVSATTQEPESPEEETEKLFKKMVVDQAIEKLQPEFKEAIKLQLLGYSTYEIAQKLNISPSLAGVRVCRGMKKLKEALRETQSHDL